MEAPRESPIKMSKATEIKRIELPTEEYNRLLKIVKNYEKSRFRSAVYAKRKHDEARNVVETKLKEVGLEKMLKKRRDREEPIVKELKLENFLITTFVKEVQE